MDSNGKRLDTTLGELIAAASEVAFEYSDNDKEAYRLARLALIEILKDSTLQIDFEGSPEARRPRKQLLH
jgi:hypothetical protein